MRPPAGDTEVVIGVDGSEQSYVAARYGLREAEALGCGVLLVHAYAPVQSDYWTGGTYVDQRLAGQQMLHDFADTLHRQASAGTTVATLLCAGEAAGALVQLSDSSPCIVVGRRRAGWLEHLVVGSVSARLSSASRCPSVTIPERCARPSHDGPIAVVVDSVAEAAGCLAYAAAAAGRHGSSVTIMQAAPLRHREWASDDDILGVSELVEVARALHPATSFTTAVTPEPIDVAAADLSTWASTLVISQRGSPNVLGWRRSVVGGVLAKASCAVVAVPSARRTVGNDLPEAERRPFRFPG